MALHHLTNITLALCVEPQFRTLWRDSPLAEPSKAAIQFRSLCFPSTQSMHSVKCHSVTSAAASWITYSFASLQPSIIEGDDLSCQHHPYTDCNHVCIHILSSLFVTVKVLFPQYIKNILTFFFAPLDYWNKAGILCNHLTQSTLFLGFLQVWMSCNNCQSIQSDLALQEAPPTS
jgi:hypothetical protein